MEFAYDVFFSYRHRPLDGEITQKCFNAIESYRLPQSKLTLRESSRSFREMLRAWFGDEPQELVDSLYYLFHRRLGDEQQVYELENPAAVISTLSDRHDPFYTMEDLFFVVFADTAVCFLRGNYE